MKFQGEGSKFKDDIFMIIDMKQSHFSNLFATIFFCC